MILNQCHQKIQDALFTATIFTEIATHISIAHSLKHQHAALFVDKHVTCTNHKHTLIFLESMVNEHVYKNWLSLNKEFNPQLLWDLAR